MDQSSDYMGREDLIVERAPSAVIERLGCTLDSWWEARYTFATEEAGDFYYEPLNAAWVNQDADSDDLAYFSNVHRISGSDQEVVSYSIPLMDENGYPYAVLGVELTTKYLSSLMPSRELNDEDQGCYALALQDEETGIFQVITANGALFSRCFSSNEQLDCSHGNVTGGFDLKGREGTALYGNRSTLEIYNNNNPFESVKLVLVALVDKESLFSYITGIKNTRAVVSVVSLLLGLCGMIVVSRHFSKPITALAKRVSSLPPQDGFQLERLNILEIDQLVDSIEDLNRNASRNIARTEFFSRMSHDMRTPMNAIISFSSREMLEGTTDDQKIEYLEKIHSSGEYLLGLINEVLDMTKIESNKVDLQYTPVKSSALWNTAIPMIDKLAQKKKIQFIREIDYHDTLVMADAQHLNQVVMNLLSNAVKFTPDRGTVRLSVKVQEMRSKGGGKGNPDALQYEVTVSDTGIGMSEAFMQNLYHPFEQENEGKEGTGLGLSIAKKLIELMDGTIECVSEKNKGTTFTLHFALQLCDASEQEEYDEKTENVVQEKKSQQKYDNLKGRRILVCEDHPLNIQIIVRLLQREGIEVITAENGKKGTELFADSEPGYFDAVLMDIRMPVMDGIQAARVIRDMKRVDSLKTPIIAMTANAFEEDVRASRAAGMNAHLSKPIEPQKLYETLNEFLRK